MTTRRRVQLLPGLETGAWRQEIQKHHSWPHPVHIHIHLYWSEDSNYTMSSIVIHTSRCVWFYSFPYPWSSQPATSGCFRYHCKPQRKHVLILTCHNTPSWYFSFVFISFRLSHNVASSLSHSFDSEIVFRSVTELSTSRWELSRSRSYSWLVPR